MSIINILYLLGGLALFLFGMEIMGKGLKQLSGNKLQKILERLTSNKWNAVILGAGVTAVVQSSSATTVMTVGLVNSGIMKLRQAIGVIMGANIGTVITSWILSLSGIQSHNIFLVLLKPSSFTPILALIGIIFLLFFKDEKKHNIAAILLGFSVLMYGMEEMSAAVKPLAQVEEFRQLFLLFSNPLLGMMVGAALTAVIQSSSASVGILQALCMTGAVTYGAAIPIIMGQNIGTCVTALLSSIGARKNARRAAFVHLYFNLLGTFLFMGIFYFVNFFMRFSFLVLPTNPADIAVVHTIFNVANTLVLINFIPQIEYLAKRTIRDGSQDADVEKDFTMLEDRLLQTPSIAVEQCLKTTMRMGHLTERALILALDLVTNFDVKKYEEVLELEDRIDRFEDHIGTYLLKISALNLNEADNMTVTTMLHSIGDLERISDHAVNVAKAAEEKYAKSLDFSEQAHAELAVFSKALRHILHMTLQVLADEDVNLAVQVEPLESVVDMLNDELKNRHIIRLRQQDCTIEMGFILSDLTTNLERVADHCSNIAVSVIEIQGHGFDTHEYLNKIKKDNEAFKKMKKAYAARYVLPGKAVSEEDVILIEQFQV